MCRTLCCLTVARPAFRRRHKPSPAARKRHRQGETPGFRSSQHGRAWPSRERDVNITMRRIRGAGAALALALAVTACATMGTKVADPAVSSLVKGDPVALGFDTAKLGE